MDNNLRKEQPGDVMAVTSAEPGYRPGDVAQPTDRVRITLRGHAFDYVVKVETGPEGPRLVALTLTGGVVDQTALRRIPLARLAAAAARWLNSGGGLWGNPGETADTRARPDQTPRRRRIDDALLTDVAETVRRAVREGHPVRAWSAAQLHTSPGTLDRWVRAAKDHGYLTEGEVPRTQRGRTTP
ncbi:hypothetical protein [Nocardia sp. NPDC047654]|uniref:hypothetical protein n=1 Tax=Nocardia sp. NPDC047654 TaxID=3364314 RepID=UPI0037217114